MTQLIKNQLWPRILQTMVDFWWLHLSTWCIKASSFLPDRLGGDFGVLCVIWDKAAASPACTGGGGEQSWEQAAFCPCDTGGAEKWKVYGWIYISNCSLGGVFFNPNKMLKFSLQCMRQWIRKSCYNVAPKVRPLRVHPLYIHHPSLRDHFFSCWQHLEKVAGLNPLAKSLQISFLNGSLIFWMHFTTFLPGCLQIELIRTHDNQWNR